MAFLSLRLCRNEIGPWRRCLHSCTDRCNVYNSQGPESTQVFIGGQTGEGSAVYLHDGIALSHKRAWNSVVGCNTMDQEGSKWRKTRWAQKGRHFLFSHPWMGVWKVAFMEIQRQQWSLQAREGHMSGGQSAQLPNHKHRGGITGGFLQPSRTATVLNQSVCISSNQKSLRFPSTLKW